MRFADLIGVNGVTSRSENREMTHRVFRKYAMIQVIARDDHVRKMRCAHKNRLNTYQHGGESVR